MNKKLTLLTGIALALSLPATAAVIVDYTPSGGTTVNMPVADQQASGADTWTFRNAGDTLGALALAGNGSGGSNMTIYGGIISTWNPISNYNPSFRELNGASLQLRVQPTAGDPTSSSVKGVYLWNQADYLVGAGSGAVLGTGSTVYWNFPNYSANTEKDLRVVVKQAGTYYISNYSTNLNQTNTATIDGTWQWAVLNTTSYTWDSFANVTLNNVQGVGIYFLATMSGTDADFATVNLTDFVVTAVPEPSSFALLAGFAAIGLVVLRRRYKKGLSAG